MKNWKQSGCTCWNQVDYVVQQDQPQGWDAMTDAQKDHECWKYQMGLDGPEFGEDNKAMYHSPPCWFLVLFDKKTKPNNQF
jgi:hypothetical protein